MRELQRQQAIEAQTQREAGEEKERAAAQAARENLVSLEVQLSRLLAVIPREVLEEGLSLLALQAQLRGRKRGSCDPGELGDALRKLGFERRRRWSGAAGFQAVWHRQG